MWIGWNSKKKWSEGTHAGEGSRGAVQRGRRKSSRAEDLESL